MRTILDYLLVMLISMLPVIELRGAIPYGYSGLAPISEPLPLMAVAAVAVIGNLIPIPFLVLFGGKVLNYLAKFEKFGKPFRKILEIGEKKVAKMNKNVKRGLFWGLFTFVAIPLPGTGAWTGALISIILGLDLKKSMPPIVLGVLGAGTIIVSLSYFAPKAFEFILGI